MNISRTSHAITIGVIVLSLVALTCSLTAHYYSVLSEQAYEQRRLMFGYTDQLENVSDRLTNSVRAYAATGDPTYMEQFRAEVRAGTREGMIAKLQGLGLEGRSWN